MSWEWIARAAFDQAEAGQRRRPVQRRPAPGRTAITSRIPVQRRAAEPAARPAAGAGVDLAAALRRIAPALPADRARHLAPRLQAAIDQAGLRTPAQQGMFVAQLAHATGGFVDGEAGFGAAAARWVTARPQPRGTGAHDGAAPAARATAPSAPDAAAPATGAGRTCLELAAEGTPAAFDQISLALEPGLAPADLAARRQYLAAAAAAFGFGDGAASSADPDADGTDASGPDPGPGASAAVQLHGGGLHDDPEEVHELAELGLSGTGGTLPHLDAIQRAFGRHAIGDVAAYVGGAATGAAAGMGALAYASGERIAFAQAPDLHTAAHEAAHVVQQRAGVALDGGVGQRDDEHERHADAVAERVVRGESAEELLARYSGLAASRDPAHTDGDGCECRDCAGSALQARPDPHAHGCDCDGCVVQRRAVAPEATPAAAAPRAAAARAILQRTDGDSLDAIRLLSLADAFAVFALADRERTVVLTSGETVTFTRRWTTGARGAAILRGELRPRIQREVHDGRADAVRTMIDATTGDAARVDELRTSLDRAIARHAAATTERRDELATGGELIEEGTQGRTMQRRGPPTRRRGETDEAYAARRAALRPGFEDEIHSAMDVEAARGTAVYAPIAGRVIWAGPGARGSGGMGTLVKLIHDTPPHTEIAGDRRVETHYCHLDEVLVARGQTVHPGQAIGLVGNSRADEGGSTGGTRTGMGPHLHFGVQIVTGDGDPRAVTATADEVANAINPAIWLSELGVNLDHVGASRPTATRGRHPVVRGAPAYPEGHDRAASTDTAPVQPRRVQQRRVVQLDRPDNLQGISNFCGTSLPASRGVVPELKDRLLAVHAHLQAQYDALPDDERTRAGSFQGYTGIQTIRGWRESSTHHGTGRAVDVNYDDQPYIVTRTTRGTRTRHGGESGSPVARVPVAQVYDRAVDFTRRSADERATADVGNRREEESATDAYRRFRRTSDALRDYLSLAFHTEHGTVSRPPIADPEGATDAELLEAIPTSERRDEADAIAAITAYLADPVWVAAHPGTPPAPRDLYLRMLRDHEIVRRPMERGEPSLSPGDTRNPARGFLHMPEHFVVAMMEVGNLRWGACELSDRANGDIHHFDLGTRGPRAPAEAAPRAGEETAPPPSRSA